jgi:hypothetical protein
MSENAQENAETTTQPEATETATVDPVVEAEKWKQLARKHEERAKANAQAAAELEELKRSMLSDTERAIEQAKAEARQATVAEYAGRLLDAKLETLLNGKTLTANAILAFDKSAFIQADGTVNDDAMRAWVDSNTATPATPAFPDLGQGTRGNAPALNSDPLLADLKAKLGIN